MQEQQGNNEEAVTSGSNVGLVQLAIVRHLQMNPGAKDTAEGVRFWCDAYGVAASPMMIAEALQGLVARGVVVAQTYRRSGRVVYSRATGVDAVMRAGPTHVKDKQTA